MTKPDAEAGTAADEDVAMDGGEPIAFNDDEDRQYNEGAFWFRAPCPTWAGWRLLRECIACLKR